MVDVIDFTSFYLVLGFKKYPMKKAFLFIYIMFINFVSMSQNTIVAHRGAWKTQKLPENSIASMLHAVELGCYGSEFDVHLTADNILIINHDDKYHDMIIEKTTLEDLHKFPLSNGEKLPILKEFFLAYKTKKTKTRLICEIKPVSSDEKALQIVELTLAMVKDLKLTSKVDYISFDYRIVKNLKKLNPKAHVQYLNGEKSPAELHADGVDGLDYHFSVFKKKPEWITEAKSLKMSLNAWTVNDEATIKWFLDNKFDQITTNEPELALELEKGKK